MCLCVGVGWEKKTCNDTDPDMHTFKHTHQTWPPSSGEKEAAFSLDVNQITSDARSRINPREPREQNESASSRPRRRYLEWREREGEKTCSLAARSTESSVFTLECQQVKVGDNTVWCCQTEFLPPNFTSSSPRPLSRLQSPPLLPPLSLSSHFNPLQQSPSVQSAQEHPLCTPKNCNPNFFLQPPPPSPPPSAESE